MIYQSENLKQLVGLKGQISDNQTNPTGRTGRKLASLFRKLAHNTPFVFGPRHNSCLITVELLLLRNWERQCSFAFFGAVKLTSSFTGILLYILLTIIKNTLNPSGQVDNACALSSKHFESQWTSRQVCAHLW